MEQIKMACLQMILVKFRRIQRRQFEQSSHHKDCRKEKIYEILALHGDAYCGRAGF